MSDEDFIKETKHSVAPKKGFLQDVFSDVSESLRGALDTILMKKKVVIIRFDGVFSNKDTSGSISFKQMKPLLDKAFSTKRLSGVVLLINSPGGMPVQVEMLASYIKYLSEGGIPITNFSSKSRTKNSKIPVISVVEDMALSGGYWLATCGDRIYASNNSLIGSIGVVYRGFGLVEMLKKVGLERRVYSQGSQKNMLDPFLPEKAEDIGIINEIQNDIFEEFKSTVKNGRGQKINLPDDDIFNGSFWSGKKALKIGLIDNIGLLHDVIRSEFGSDCVVTFLEKNKFSWFRKPMVDSQEILSLLSEEQISFVAKK